MLLSFSSGSPHQNFSCVLAGICLLAVLACADTLEAYWHGTLWRTSRSLALNGAALKQLFSERIL